MTSRGYNVAVGIMVTLVSLIAALVSLVVLGYVEMWTVPGLIERLVFGGDPSAALGLGFVLIAAAMTLIPVDIAAAVLIGFWVFGALLRRARA